MHVQIRAVVLIIQLTYMTVRRTVIICNTQWIIVCHRKYIDSSYLKLSQNIPDEKVKL